jgi:hypothetical protein
METRSRSRLRARTEMSGEGEADNVTPPSPHLPAPDTRQAPATGTGITTGTGSSQQSIDPAIIAQIVSATISALNLPFNQPPAPAQPSSGKHLRAADLPVFKGYSLDGADASSFLDSLDTIFTLAKTVEEDKTRYASLAFPVGTPAQSWYIEQRDLGLFRTATDPSTVLRYDLFKQAFAARFSTPLSRRYYLEDLWDKFSQKGTVTDHHVRFTKLWHQLQQLGITFQPDVVASKYLRSLKSELFQIVCNKNQVLPDFDTVHKQAIEAEYQLRPASNSNRTIPELRGIFSKNRDKEIQEKAGNPSSGTSNTKWCVWHKRNNDHDTKDCPKINELKRQGKWKGKD